MYVNVRLHTTVYNILRHDVQQCTTMFDNVRQKLLPYDSIFVAPKSFTWKTFFLIRSIAYENLRLTANNRENPRQSTKNYDFLIRTLSHLKIRMWESSISEGQHIYNHEVFWICSEHVHPLEIATNPSCDCHWHPHKLDDIRLF